MTAWPSSLPDYVLQQGHNEALANVSMRSQMDAGPAKVRRRFTAGPRMVNAIVRLTTGQTLTLDTFFETTLVGGSLAFDWVLPRTQASRSFRFTSPPEYRPVGPGIWDATLKLEAMP
jgi:hypothetical protein